MKNLFLFTITILLFNCKSDKTELVGHLGRPDFSPDGNKIVFIYAKDASKDVWEIYSSDSNGNHVERLTHFAEARIKKGPVWSPDGKKIAFHADIGNGAQIFLMDADGENLTQLTNLEGYNVEPHWSPKGDKIVFNSISDDGKAQIAIMNNDGTEVIKLEGPDGDNWYPRITAQNEVIFTSNLDHENYYDIFIMNSDATNIRQLTAIKAINWFPEYSPDESKIVFHSNQDDPELNDSGDYNLYLMNHDGTGLKQITDLEGQELHAKWHPSGKELIFEWHNEKPMGLYTLNLTTGDVAKIKMAH